MAPGASSSSGWCPEVVARRTLAGNSAPMSEDLRQAAREGEELTAKMFVVISMAGRR